ncbi:MAG TPA: BBP7 family outer membrane beta-barrel protein [Pirellulales bacterium]|nr:BBP7 family outer membrane beta-barrel protein [Pirellulales bacterium]
MSLTRCKVWLIALGMQMLLASAANAQVPPFAPADDPTAFGAGDVSLFAQPDLSLFGNGPQPNYGYFGSVEALGWSITNPVVRDFGLDGGSRQVYQNNGIPGQFAVGGVGPPVVSTISLGTVVITATASLTFPIFDTIITQASTSSGGSNGANTELINNNQITVQQGANNIPLTTERNTLNTNWLNAPLTSGVRFDFGYIDDETDRGWLFSSYTLNDQVQNNVMNNVSAVFDDVTNAATVYNGLSTYTSTNTATQIGIPISVTGTAGNSGTVTVTFQTSSFASAVTVQTAQAPQKVGLLEGFISYPSNTATGATNPYPNGFAADLNHNGVYGPYGVDFGTPAGNVFNPPLDGIPDFALTNGTQILTDYGDAVPLPVLFRSVTSSYKSGTWGIEANRLYRIREPGRLGGRWDLFAGARYIDFHDQYNILATGGILDTTTVNTSAFNRIVGPQIGFRWTKSRGRRWSFAAEARAMAGADFQTARLNGAVGSNLTQLLPSPLPTNTQVTSGPDYQVNYNTNTVTYTSNQVATTVPTQQANNPGGGPTTVRLNQPLNLNPTNYTSSRNYVEFTPAFELRAKLVYQLFRQVNLSAGWTGTYIDGVARSSNQVNYVLPSFSLVTGQNRQGVFLNGLTLGVEINR